MLNAGLSAFGFCEEGRQLCQPLLTAANQVLSRQGIGQFLQGFRIGAVEEGIAWLLEADTLVSETVGEPVMLVQTEASGKGKVRADPNEHPAPLAVIQVEVVLLDPALFELQMPAVFFLVSDRCQNACRLPGLEIQTTWSALALLK